MEDNKPTISKSIFSPFGLVALGMVLMAVLMLIGKLFGASYYFIASITLVFLIILIIYLVLHLFEGRILKKFRKCITKNGE